MIELYFVRHGQTEWNQIRKLQGIQDSPLTAEGIDQANTLRDSFTISFDRVISSPLGRATQTARILAKSVPISTDPLLAEMGFGSAEGLEKEVFKELYPEPFFNLWHHADQYDPAAFGGETFESVERRAQNFLESLKSIPAGSKILIVSHGMILKIIFGLIWNHGLTQFWNDQVPLNTSITKVVLTKGIFAITDFSNVDHLENTEVISYV